jgi:hypothetical protein
MIKLEDMPALIETLMRFDRLSKSIDQVTGSARLTS